MKSRRDDLEIALSGSGLALRFRRFVGSGWLPLLIAAGLTGIGLLTGCGKPEIAARPNVLLVTLDTTRADHLGCYGYERPTTPNLDALAAKSTLYENAYSTSSWTLPAHASLFTGKFPTTHGVRHDPDGPLVLAEAIRAPENIRARGLSPDEQTLAGVLARSGYATGAVVAGPWLMRVFGFDAGFDHYDDSGIRKPGGRRARSVTDGAIEWLTGLEPETPFFLFLNYFDPHAPYNPPAAWARSFLPPGVVPNIRAQDQAIDLYDAEILFMDSELGRLLRTLKERGLTEDTLIVVTSDHGELFGDHGEWGHERFLWEELVHVPLIVKPPGAARRGRRVETRVQLVDLLPLILEKLGIAAPAGVQGGTPPKPGHPVLAEVNPISASSGNGEWRAQWTGSFKFLWNTLGERYLFDLSADPRERTNLVDTRAERARSAEVELHRVFESLPRAAAPDAPVRAVDEKTREALREMGYLE